MHSKTKPNSAICEVGLSVSQKDTGLEGACDSLHAAHSLQCNGLKKKRQMVTSEMGTDSAEI